MPASGSRPTGARPPAPTSSRRSNGTFAPLTRAWRSRSSRAGSSTIRSSSPSNSRHLKRSFAVVTDSTSDVPEAWRQRYDIEVVPLKVLFGEETFRDGVDMNNEEFFARLATSTKLPTTSAPSPGDFAEVEARLLLGDDRSNHHPIVR